MIDSKAMQRSQVAELLANYAVRDDRPTGGWIRAIRESLGMTQAQLAARIGLARQSVQDFEKAEAQRRITLESLDRAAAAMGCKLVYSLVPQNGSLDEMRERRALEVAEEILKSASHSMALEAQGVSGAERERQKKLIAQSLLRGSSRGLWVDSK